MVIGSVLIYHEFIRSRRSAIGFASMALAGLGTFMVGIFAENTNAGLHEYLDDLQTNMNQVGAGIHETFFALKTLCSSINS